MQLEFLSRIKKAFLVSEAYMLLLAIMVLFQTGINHPVAIRFNYKFEPTNFAPAIIAVFILPVLVGFVYYMSQREPEKLNQIAYWIYCGILLIIMAAQTLICITSL